MKKLKINFMLKCLLVLGSSIPLLAMENAKSLGEVDAKALASARALAHDCERYVRSLRGMVRLVRKSGIPYKTYVTREIHECELLAERLAYLQKKAAKSPDKIVHGIIIERGNIICVNSNGERLKIRLQNFQNNIRMEEDNEAVMEDLHYLFPRLNKPRVIQTIIDDIIIEENKRIR